MSAKPGFRACTKCNTPRPLSEYKTRFTKWCPGCKAAHADADSYHIPVGRSSLGVVANPCPSYSREAMESALYGEDDAAEGTGTLFGESRAIAAKRTGLSFESISRAMRNREIHDPYLDEVAVERALQGDLAAMRSLTVWERAEFYVRLDALSRAWQNQDWNDGFQSGGRHPGQMRFGDKAWGLLIGNARDEVQKRERAVA